MQRLDAETRIDRAVAREAGRMTAGASALHQADPFAIVCMLEDAEKRECIAAQEREALRKEVFAGFLDYLFADGPDPREVRARAEGFLVAYSPETARKVRGEREWITPAAVVAVFANYNEKLREASDPTRGALADWNDELVAEQDNGTVRATLRELARLLVSQGETWRAVTATALALAKAFRPEVVGGMSLEHLAVLSGDSGRATPSARIKRLYNRRVERAGCSGAFVHFQKTASVVEKYRAAATGNRNRAKRKRKP